MKLKIINNIMNDFNNKGYIIYSYGNYVLSNYVFNTNVWYNEILLATNADKDTIIDIIKTSKYNLYNKKMIYDNDKVIFYYNYVKIIIQPCKTFQYADKDNNKIIVLNLKNCDHYCDIPLYMLLLTYDEKLFSYNCEISYMDKNIHTVSIASLYNESCSDLTIPYLLSNDPLLLLKAITLASIYNLSLNEKLIEYSKFNKTNIYENENDRTKILKYFNKIICCQKPSIYVRLLYDMGILEQMIPEISEGYNFDQHRPNHSDIFTHLLDVMDHTEPKVILRLAALFHDIGKPKTFSFGNDNIGHFNNHEICSAEIANKRLTEMGYYPGIVSKVTTLVYYHMNRYNNILYDDKTIKTFIDMIGINMINDLFSLQIADTISSQPPYKLDKIFKLKFACQQYIQNNDKSTILSITKKDIIESGIYNKNIDIAYNYAFNAVKNKTIRNSKSDILSFICKKFK